MGGSSVAEQPESRANHFGMGRTLARGLSAMDGGHAGDIEGISVGILYGIMVAMFSIVLISSRLILITHFNT